MQAPNNLKAITFSHTDGTSIQFYFSNNPYKIIGSADWKVYMYCVGCGINRFPTTYDWQNPEAKISWGESFLLCKDCDNVSNELAKYVPSSYFNK